MSVDEVLQENMDNAQARVIEYMEKVQSSIRATKDPKVHKLEALLKVQRACEGLTLFIEKWMTLEKVQREASPNPLKDIVPWWNLVEKE